MEEAEDTAEWKYFNIQGCLCAEDEYLRNLLSSKQFYSTNCEVTQQFVKAMFLHFRSFRKKFCSTKHIVYI